LLGFNRAFELRPELADLRLPLQFVPPGRLVLAATVPRAPVHAAEQVAEGRLEGGVAAGAAESPGGSKVAQGGGAEIAAGLVANDADEGRLLMQLLQELPDLWRRHGLRLDAALGRAFLAEEDFSRLTANNGRDGEDPLAFLAVLAEH
jgi:hypothetical protein